MKLSGHPKVTCTEPYVTERLHNIEHHLGFTPGRSSVINEIILLHYDKCINNDIERQHGRFGLKYSRILARVLIPSSVFFRKAIFWRETEAYMLYVLWGSLWGLTFWRETDALMLFDRHFGGKQTRPCFEPDIDVIAGNFDRCLILVFSFSGKPVPLDVYERIRELETRILHLESLSPEYFNKSNVSRTGIW